MSVQIQRSLAGSATAFGTADDGGASSLEPPDSSSSTNRISSTSSVPPPTTTQSRPDHQHQQRDRRSTGSSSNRKSPPRSLSALSAALPNPPAHLLLTHNNGPITPHTFLLDAPLSGPPAPEGILPPGSHRKLSFSDNQPIVPSPLHLELSAPAAGAEAEGAQQKGPPAALTTTSLKQQSLTQKGEWSPLRNARPSDTHESHKGSEGGDTAIFPAILNKASSPRNATGDDHDDDEEEEEEEDTTPTSSTCSSSEMAESEHSRSSYESSVLTPISEAPDPALSFTSAGDEHTPTVISLASPTTTTTTRANVPFSSSMSFHNKTTSDGEIVQPSPVRPPPVLCLTTTDDEELENHDDDDGSGDAKHQQQQQHRAGLGEEDSATPTNSMIRSRSELVANNPHASAAPSTATSTAPVVVSPSTPTLASTTSATTVAASSSSPLTSTTNLGRSGSGRRLSCPTRASKMKLRPCFRRRSSAQNPTTTSTPTTSTSVLSEKDDGATYRNGYLRSSSSTNDDYLSAPSSNSRGRSVRFSPGPPQELRTHSPVEYDRKSCAVNHRLTAEDVEEMRRMEMGLGLLEAKWAAVVAARASTSVGGSSDSTTAMREAASPVTTPTGLEPASAAEEGRVGGGGLNSAEHDDGTGAGTENVEAEIRFHSTAGVAGMRRSSGRAWERERESRPSARDDTPVGLRGRPHSASASGTTAAGGTSSDRLLDPASSSPFSTISAGSGTGTGITRRGTLTRANSSAAAVSTAGSSSATNAYNGPNSRRAEYSDSSESEYEYPRRGLPGSYANYPSSSTYRPSSASSSSSTASLRTKAKGNTDAPILGERIPRRGYGAQCMGGVTMGWQPPNWCRNGYLGGVGGAGAAGTLGGGGGPVGAAAASSSLNGQSPPSSLESNGGVGLLSAPGGHGGVESRPGSSSSGGSGSAAAPCHSSIIARFGLTTPPPPLPGMPEPSPTASLLDHHHHHHAHHHHPLPGWGHGFASAHSSPGHGGYGAGAPNGRVLAAGGAMLRNPSPNRGGGGGGGGRYPTLAADFPGSGTMIPALRRTSPPVSPVDGQREDQGAAAAGAEESTKASKDDRGASSPVFSSRLSSSSCASIASGSGLSGYDSPASEFCYESGSEYDLIG